MAELSGREYKYTAELTETHKGAADGVNWGVDKELVLKEGASVIMLKNDPKKRGSRWINGTIGRIKHLSRDSIKVSINGCDYDVQKETWETKEFEYDRKHGRFRVKTIAKLTQYPIKLAWAFTIHKSQGRTFDKILIDLEQEAFATGQTYVALSRCTSLGGIILRRPFKLEDVKVDNKVVQFYAKASRAASEYI